MSKTPEINPVLTRAGYNILRLMKEDFDSGDTGELVFSKGGGWWIGLHQVKSGRRYVEWLQQFLLLRFEDSCSREGYEVYTLNSESLKVLEDVNYVPSMVFVTRGCPGCKSKSVCVVGDTLECRDCGLEKKIR